MNEETTARYEGMSDGSEIETPSAANDYFFQCNGDRFAGLHLIVDLWGAHRLDDKIFIEQTLRDCVDAAGATLLHIHLHNFTENCGVSGVAVLAESHISIHTWPEWNYAAVDVFMCGGTDPMKAADILREAFKPVRLEIADHYRGRIC